MKKIGVITFILFFASFFGSSNIYADTLKCSDGTPADGSVCSSDNTRVCLPDVIGGGASCKPKPLTLSCSDGTPADGSTCKSDSTRVCLANGYGGGASCFPKQTGTVCADGSAVGKPCKDGISTCTTNITGGTPVCVPFTGPSDGKPSTSQLEMQKIDFSTIDPLQIGGGPNALAGAQSSDVKLNTPGAIISRALTYAIPAAGLILFVMIIWGGFEMVMGAAADKKDAGRQRITTAIIGFLLLFAVYWIAQLVQIIFGVKFLG